MRMFFQTALHVLWHAFLDSIGILPFLILTYLCMELLEHKAGARVQRTISRAGKAGPLLGGAVGLLPQCGFSAAAAGLYAGRVVTLGTVIAVFLSTSDEMIAVFLGKGLPLRVIFITLAVKLLVAVLFGFVVDLLLARRQAHMHIHAHCEEAHCGCERGLWRSVLHHTLQIFLFIYIINVALGALLELVDAERLALFLGEVPVLSQAVAALIGLIPNCAASVAVATLYADGLLSAGAMLAGLLTGAGAGLLVLFRTNKKPLENLAVVAALFAIGVLVGCVLDYTGLALLIGL